MQPFNRATTPDDSGRTPAYNRQGRILLPSPYGFRSFNNNQDAQAFINTALNSGPGYTGVVAAATRLDDNYLADNGRRALTGFTTGGDQRVNGVQALTASGTRVGLHGPRSNPLLNAVSNVPLPASAMLLLAEVDTPIRPGPACSNPPSYNLPPTPPPTPANSVRSIGSVPSTAATVGERFSLSVPSRGSSFACPCMGCRRRDGCVCHMYCTRHAMRECPVHGMGRGLRSDDESGSSMLSCDSFSDVSSMSSSGLGSDISSPSTIGRASDISSPSTSSGWASDISSPSTSSGWAIPSPSNDGRASSGRSTTVLTFNVHIPGKGPYL